MDKRALMAEIARNGSNCSRIAKQIGMDRSTFSKKINGASEFKQSEIQQIIRVLNIDNPMPIFFAEREK